MGCVSSVVHFRCVARARVFCPPPAVPCVPFVFRVFFPLSAFIVVCHRHGDAHTRCYLRMPEQSTLLHEYRDRSCKQGAAPATPARARRDCGFVAEDFCFFCVCVMFDSPGPVRNAHSRSAKIARNAKLSLSSLVAVRTRAAYSWKQRRRQNVARWRARRSLPMRPVRARRRRRPIRAFTALGAHTRAACATALWCLPKYRVSSKRARALF